VTGAFERKAKPPFAARTTNAPVASPPDKANPPVESGRQASGNPRNETSIQSPTGSNGFRSPVGSSISKD